jgi:hypothetical protein
MAALSTPPRGPTAAPSYCRSERTPPPARFVDPGATRSRRRVRGSLWQVSPTGELTVSQSVTSGGICPRHFVLDYAPAGDAWLRIANQDSQTIVSYLLGKNGEMTAPGDGLWQTVWASPATLELDGLCPSVITPPAPPPIWQLSEAGPTAAIPATGVIRSSFKHMFGALA